MSSAQTFQQEIVATAEEGGLVLTVNNRLARQLKSLFDARMREDGRSAWRSPRIFSLDSWLVRSLEGMGEGETLLGPFAALRLWEGAVEGDLEQSGPGLLQVPATATRAMEAHRLLAEYRAERHTESLTEDHAAFLRWRQRFAESCRGGGWLDPAHLAERVGAGIRQGRVPLPPRVLLAGFDEIPPKVRRLADAFAAVGSTVSECPPPAEPCGDLLRIECGDMEDEVRRAARWVRNLIEKGGKRIGIVVLDLQGYRPLVERIFRAEIDPGAVVALDDEEGHFSLSLGAPLSEQGLVAAALEILDAGDKLTLDAASFLLRTPYLGGGIAEMNGRAVLERRLRSRRAPMIRCADLRELAAERREGGKPALPVFAAICAALESGRSDGRKRSPGEWAIHFADLLQSAGWPGERPLGSHEYQVLKTWREKLLPAMVSLEAVSPRLERSAALSLLRRMAKEIPFQPETPSGPVQVVGHLEAAGLHFDHLWVMGLTDDALPAPPRPNPFIPVSLQMVAGMPHASARRELDFARLVIRRLCAAAPRVVFSHPLRDGDCGLRPSALIAHLPPAQVELAESRAPEVVMQEAPPVLETTVDTQGPPLAGDITSGGTAILRDQALCPFRAFAHHRLGVRALDRPEIGLDAGTRGTLLHEVLRRFWDRTRDHAGLCALGDRGLLERVRACVEEALFGHFGSCSDDALPPLLAIERSRLAALVGEWLVQVERPRPPFSVDSREGEHVETIGDLTIRTQVDRIDTLSNGATVILDYKTGRVEPGDLLGERLVEPQLPIYALNRLEGRLSAVAFAVVRRGECAFKGVAMEGDLLPGIGALTGSKLGEKHDVGDWPDLLERWRRQLRELAGEFARGEAAVDPVDFIKACRFCDLPPLCRIDENEETP